MPGLFAEQAMQTPERIAWEHGGEDLGYGELDRRSNQLARFLLDMGCGQVIWWVFFWSLPPR